MIKIISQNYFVTQRPTGACDVYTLGQRCEPVKCCTCISPNEAIAWVNRQEAKGNG